MEAQGYVWVKMKSETRQSPAANQSIRNGDQAKMKPVKEQTMTLNYHLQGPNVVNYHATQEDIDCLFGDMDGSVEPVVVMNVNCLRWDEIAIECKFFSSKGQARKNGWDGFVPHGFGQRKFGKQGKGVWYFNPEMNNE